MSALRQSLRRALEAALPRDRFLVRGPRGDAGVALTFDDGPHPEITPRLLDALAAHEMRATFFVVGREAERHPAIVRRIAQEGHALGHHSWTHSEPAHTSAATLLQEVARCRALLADLTGAPSDRFRPPKGQLSVAKLAGLLRAGQRVILWSDDPKDYALADAAPLVAWADAATLAPGAVVLLHDVHAHCLAALPALAARGRATGRRFVTLDAWLPAAA